MLSWGDFYVLMPHRDLAAVTTTDEDGVGQYPDALWWHHGQEELARFRNTLKDRHAAGRLLQFGGCWGWTRCRVATAPKNTLTMSLPGVREPITVSAESVFQGKDFRCELDRRAGPIPLPLDTDGVNPAAAWANGEAFQAHALRRDLASMDMVLEIAGGRSPIPTLEDARTKRNLRERERREVAHVTKQPTVLAEMLKFTKAPRKNAKRGTEILSVDQVRGEVLTDSTVRLTARLAPDCRTLLHGKPRPAKVPRLTGMVSQQPLAWEERRFDISENPSALQLAQGLLEMCADIDLDFHRSATAVAAEMMRTGRVTISIERMYRLRGGDGNCGQQDRVRLSRHLAIMQRLEMEVDLPDGRGILVIPFAAGGTRVLNSTTRAVQARSFHAVPDSIVGMMLAEGGHRWQYWLDERVQHLDDDLAYSLHHVLARQWSARMTRNAVQGPTRYVWNLSTVLDATSIRETWRKRMAKQGKPWLRKRVDGALGDLRGTGLFGLAGSAKMEWDEHDIAASKMVFGEPPPHILEAHLDRNSRRIAGAAKKRIRLDVSGKGGGNSARVGKGRTPGRKGKNTG